MFFFKLKDKYVKKNVFKLNLKTKNELTNYEKLHFTNALLFVLFSLFSRF